MFFFMEEEKPPVWRQYMEELGIQRAIDSLKQKGLPCQWPMHVADPKEPYTLKAHPYMYPSRCPHFGGYWLRGGTGGVDCKAAGEMLPGVVWYEVCRKEFEKCPFYGRKEIDICSK